MTEVTYAYTRLAFKGAQVFRAEFVITGTEIEKQIGKAGRLGFLELLNKWNQTGLAGIAQSGIIYLYVGRSI